MAENLKTLATYATPVEADVVRNRLEASGIQAFLADDQTAGWLWHLGAALRGVKVLVAESDLPGALEMLEDLQRSRAQDAPSPVWPCPKCGAEVDGEMDVCWACGTTADGVEDADFQDAEAAVTPTPARQTGPKGPPGPGLAVLIAFCVPMYIFNTLIGTDVLTGAAAYPTSGGLLLLVLAVDLLLVVGLFQWFYYLPTDLPEVETAAERLEAAADAAIAEEQDWELALAVAMARRACLAALLGMVFCPLLLNVYSIWLIVRYGLCRSAVLRRSGFLVYSAILIDAVALSVWLVFFLASGGFTVG